METSSTYRNLFSGPASGQPERKLSFPMWDAPWAGRPGETEGQESFSSVQNGQKTATDGDEGADQEAASFSSDLSAPIRAFLTALQERGISTLFGTSGDDTISGWSDSVVAAGDGDDLISVWSNSVVDGGNGNDEIYAWSESAVDAGAGDDWITVLSDSLVDGGSGDDVITAFGNSVLNGGSGDDYIHALGSSRITGGQGDDRITVTGEGSVVLFDAGDGHDQIKMASGGTIQIGSGLSVEDVQLQVEGNVATVRFTGSEDWLEIQMVPGRPVQLAFDNGGSLELEPDDAFKAEYEAAKVAVREKLKAGESAGFEDFRLLSV